MEWKTSDRRVHIRRKWKKKSGGKIRMLELVKSSTVFSITQKGDTHFKMSVPVYQLCLSTFQLTSLKNTMSSSVFRMAINYDLTRLLIVATFHFHHYVIKRAVSFIMLEFLLLENIIFCILIFFFSCFRWSSYFTIYFWLGDFWIFIVSYNTKVLYINFPRFFNLYIFNEKYCPNIGLIW